MRDKENDFWKDVGKSVCSFVVIAIGLYVVDALAGHKVGFLRT